MMLPGALKYGGLPAFVGAVPHLGSCTSTGRRKRPGSWRLGQDVTGPQGGLLSAVFGYRPTPEDMLSGLIR